MLGKLWSAAREEGVQRGGRGLFYFWVRIVLTPRDRKKSLVLGNVINGTKRGGKIFSNLVSPGKRVPEISMSVERPGGGFGKGNWGEKHCQGLISPGKKT